MLIFSEAVMSLLIIEHTSSFLAVSNLNAREYYDLTLIGVLNIVVLQAFEYETEPHNHHDN